MPESLGLLTLCRSLVGALDNDCLWAHVARELFWVNWFRAAVFALDTSMHMASSAGQFADGLYTRLGRRAGQVGAATSAVADMITLLQLSGSKSVGRSASGGLGAHCCDDCVVAPGFDAQ